MTRRPSADRLLRRVSLAGYAAAGAAGALTVGLIAGITHSASQASTPGGTTSGAVTGDDGGLGSSSDDGGFGTTQQQPAQQLPQGGLGVPQQGSMPQGGSHGS